MKNCKQEFESVFHYLDKDGDGKISPVELRQCIMKIDCKAWLEDADEAIIESLDSDGDGLLDLEDFIGLMEVDGGEEEEAKLKDLREAFGMYEMEGTGYITPKSLKRMLSRIGESRTVNECEAMINLFDLNGDGVISFDEFRLMML
ncbi:putative calcium-binding protein CML19 [Telopea speciosissima]|uniref:putative calcium-binding protein CML19 n=1 Tax=Telopea speciosissima TaxID=54955 RepID=UPI001CC6484C|nr:putative calcium-binding protein CML19 [Telopea speciosissima]